MRQGLRIHPSYAIGLLVLAASALVAAQEQPPRFRTGINVIQIDATVLDRDGKPVRGLTESEFTVLENGRPQRLIGLSEVVLPDPVEPSTPWLRDVVPDVADNQGPEGRLLVLVLDDAMLPPDPAILKASKDIARGAIERMGPADRMAVVFTRDNRNAQDFTADRSKLQNAIERTSIGFMFAAGTPSRHFYEASIGTLRLVAEALRKVPYRRKAIVYVSVGVPVDYDRVGRESLRGIGDTSISGGLLDRVRDVFGQALWSNTAIYSFDPSGLGGLEAFAATRPKVQIGDPRRFRWFLEDVAENTGGRATLQTNGYGHGLNRMFEETSSYYLLGYESTSDPDDGKFRRVEVRTSRAGASVRARTGYFARRDRDERRKRDASPSTTLAIADVIPRSDLPIQAVAAPFAVSGAKDAAIAIVVRLRHGGPQTGLQQQVELLVAAFDHDGRQRRSQSQSVGVRLREGEHTETTYELLTRIDLRPGRYSVRIGAHNTAIDKSGSVFVDIDVPDFSNEPLSLSGLLVTASSSPTAAPKDALQPIVPVVPSTQREFARQDRVSGFLRIYQGGKSPLQPVSMAVRLLDATGRIVSQRTESISSDRFIVGRAFDYPVPIDVSALPTGAYLLEVEAQTSMVKAQRRQVRFEVS